MDPFERSKEEVGRLGDDLYERQLREKVEADDSNLGKIIVFDVDTGDYEIDDVGLNAAHRLKARRPDGTFYGRRIGYDAVYAFGGATLARTKR